MKIISWNVNGIRSCLSKGFEDFVSKNNPDIICIQETKANPDQVNLEIPGFKQFWNMNPITMNTPNQIQNL